MSIKNLAKGRTDVYRLSPNDLHIKTGWNSRNFDDPSNKEHVEQLAASIAEIGVKEPLKIVYEDGFAYVTNGECRLRAVKLAISRGAEIETVPCMIEDRYGNEADRLFTQIASNSGKPFTQLEQANLFKRLLGFGWQQTDIAKKAGISNSRVSQILNILTLPTDIQNKIQAGEVSVGLATQVYNNDKENASEVLNKAVETAKSEGAKRAAPKHLGDKAPSAAKIVKNAIEEAMAGGHFDESEEMVTISFPDDTWAMILSALKL